MDTKWKNILRSNALKIVSFLLAVVLFTSGLSLFETSISQAKKFGFSDTWDNENFYESRTLSAMTYDVFNDLYTLVGVYESEEHIKSGELISEADLNTYKTNLFEKDYNEGIWDDTRTDDETYSKWKEEIIASKAFEDRHAAEIKKWKEAAIKDQLDDYHQIINRLDSKKEQYGLQWTAAKGDVTSSSGGNVKTDAIKKAKVYYVNNMGRIDTSMNNVNISPGMYSDSIEYVSYGDAPAHGNTDCTIAFAYDDAKMDELAGLYAEERGRAQLALSQLIVLTSLALAALVICMIGIGHRPEDDQASLIWEDYMGADLHLCGVFVLASMAYAGGAACLVYEMPLYNGLLLNAAGTALAINWILSVTRSIKARGLLKNLFIVRVCRWCLIGLKWIGRQFKRFSAWISGYYHQFVAKNNCMPLFIGFVVLLIISVALVPFFIGLIGLGVIIYKGIKKSKNMDAIIKGVETMHAGDLNHKIDVTGKGKLVTLANQINTIQEGMNQAVAEAVDREIKSERMKTELITNVSHDIRTPLTSIINYIDLMKQPDITEEDRAHYLDVLTTKADRLKALTDDLFEAAKASSGSMEVHYEAVNLESLLDQGMGELEDKIAATNLDFIIDRPKEKLLVHADGRLLWRVIENLLGNVLKYALDGSRVYIAMTKEDDYGVFEIKNISSAPLNIPADELMERFKRGDATRHSEGSGLGLSIAKDLTTLQQGLFELAIDGDLFKATVKIPLES